jgi:hypothetical protein
MGLRVRERVYTAYRLVVIAARFTPLALVSARQETFLTVR